jgi:hypothetical protein
MAINQIHLMRGEQALLSLVVLGLMGYGKLILLVIDKHHGQRY